VGSSTSALIDAHARTHAPLPDQEKSGGPQAEPLAAVDWLRQRHHRSAAEPRGLQHLASSTTCVHVSATLDPASTAWVTPAKVIATDSSCVGRCRPAEQVGAAHARAERLRAPRR
jgi:hypothetical protein